MKECTLTLERAPATQKSMKNLKGTTQELISTYSLKQPQLKKLRFRVWAHSPAEYFYILTKSGLTLRHRTYAINQRKEDLLKWEENNLQKKVFGMLGVEKDIEKDKKEDKERRDYQ